MYPNYTATYANVAALPGTATVNDYAIVTDDGDGKSAGYIWTKIDSVEQWIKRYDVDFNNDSILSETLLSTRAIYLHKWGNTDNDENGSAFTGDLAGQRIYGGDTANQHLILYANSGDAAGNTGYVQFGDNARPLVDSTFDFGTTTYRWSNIFTDSLTSGTLIATGGSITDTSGAISFGDENLSTTGTFGAGVITGATGSSFGTLTLADGSITDSGGTISFGNENLSTTGTLASGVLTVSSDLVIGSGSITSVSGAISFGDENLSTTGTLGAGTTTVTQLNADNTRLDGNTLSATNLNGSLILVANGSGVVDVQSALTTLGQTVTGTLGVTGILNADNLRIDGNTLSSTDTNGNVVIDPNGTGLFEVGAGLFPTTDSSFDLGKTGNVFNDIWFDGSLQDGTNAFLMSELIDLRSANWRDAGRTMAAQAGDALFWSGTQWLASNPDSEILHEELGNLTTTDAGHTQFAMLAGRAGGQAVQGGTAASENLDLESTSHATKGDIRVKDDVIPFVTAAYSGGWSGTDLGGASNFYNDLYMRGEAKNLRAENFTFAGLPASSSQNPGRLMFTTDTLKLYIDTGAAVVPVGEMHKFISDVAFDGIVTTVNVDVSSTITDARNCIKQLFDNTNDYESMAVSIKATSASNIRITTNLPLPAASYRLVVLEDIG